jgi:hypothetical protein
LRAGARRVRGPLDLRLVAETSATSSFADCHLAPVVIDGCDKVYVRLLLMSRSAEQSCYTGCGAKWAEVLFGPNQIALEQISP